MVNRNDKNHGKGIYTAFGFRIAVIIAFLLATVGCQPVQQPSATAAEVAATSTAAPTQPPLQYSGEGPGSISIGPWNGAAVLHIVAQAGSQPFHLTLQKGLNRQLLIDANGAVDEYRGVAFGPAEQARLEIESDRPWEVTLMQPAAPDFPQIKVPGKMDGQGNAVILLDGAHSIAIFEADQLEAITAWAYDPTGTGSQLSFKTEGSFSGRAVLPETASWMIISTSIPWSVEVQAHCCEKPPGL